MLRFAVLVLLALVVWTLLRRLLAAAVASHVQRQPGDGRSGGARAAERLVRCEVCGVRVPESRALAAAGGRYCSQGCRQVALRDSA